jgi:peroxiredoxin
VPLKFPSSLGLLCLGLGLGLGVPLHAAFELVGELPATFTGLAVTVSRDSLETRTSTPVGAERVSGTTVRVRVEAEAGLFTVRIGEVAGSFVATDGRTLQFTAAADGKSLKVAGGPEQDLYIAYENFRAASLARHLAPVREAIAAARDDAELARHTEKEVTATLDHRRELNDFTLARLRGSPALYASSLRWDGDHRLEELAAAVSEYSRLFPAQEIARLMEARIARFRATAIGAVAPALVGPSPSGAPLRLADLRGRHVLVDFWASWCGPCRVENRNYVELYRRYRGAGLEILAVSVDQNAVAWKAAIAKDDARWLHLSDLQGWQTPLAAAYNVTALPASFLLDPEGRIIARDLRGKKLAERLEALFPPGKKNP